MKIVIQVETETTVQELSLERGVLKCEPGFRALLEFHTLGEWYGVHCGPQLTGDNVLRDPIALWDMLKKKFIDVRLISGKMPEPEQVPPGAIS